MLGLLYIECGLLRTRFLPFFSKFNTVWGGKGVPTLLTSVVGKNAFFPFPQTKMQNLLVFHAVGNILREPQSGCSHSPVPFLCW